MYGIDRELEKRSRDVGGRTSNIGFVDGYTNLIIDDEKMRMRSTKANNSSLSRHKSQKSFGPVGNCINSILTGMVRSCDMNHHGESAKDILTARLMLIKGINNPNSIHFPATTCVFKVIPNHKGLCFVYSKHLEKLIVMVQSTQLSLPKAHKIIPEIVPWWNRLKGRVDKMTRYLDGMNFSFAKGTPKQQLVMMEFIK